MDNALLELADVPFYELLARLSTEPAKHWALVDPESDPDKTISAFGSAL